MPLVSGGHLLVYGQYALRRAPLTGNVSKMILITYKFTRPSSVYLPENVVAIR